MNRCLPVLLALFAPFVQATTAMAAGAPEISQAWSRPAAAGTNGVGFMILTNRGPVLDTLTAVETPAAKRAEIHRTTMKNGVMSMQRQTGVAIPPGGAVAFAPGGYHVMLIGLTAPLKAGDKVPATLVFAKGGRVKVAFTVSATPPAASAGEHQHH
jgi:copper(I)-binding protein